MAAPEGRRASNKLATRVALQAAARELFDAHGYEATSVREITERAGVGERTFYRYFESKDDLVSGELEDWLELIGRAIRGRPAGPGPLGAVRDALLELAAELASGAQSRPIWLLSDRPRPAALLRESAARPLIRFERAITDALLDRAGSLGEPLTTEDAELVARLSLAALRSAMIIERRERRRDPNRPTPTGERVARAFAGLAAHASTL